MAIQNNLEAPIVATSAADALRQYDEAKKAKQSAGKPKKEKAKKATPAKKKAPAKKAAKKAKVASKPKQEKKKAPRTFNAAITGTTLKSRMVRISTELADYLTGEAAKNDITVTEASRVLVEGMLK